MSPRLRRRSYPRAVLIAVLVLLAYAARAAEPTKTFPQTPGAFLAAGVTLFCRATIAPLDADSFAFDLARELAGRVPGLRVRAIDGRPALVDDLGPDRPLPLAADLADRPEALAEFADGVAWRRPGLDAVAAYREALSAVVGRIDPYASVEPLRVYDEQVNRLEKRVVGIGIAWNPTPEGALVVEVVPRSPAARAGLRPGDRIVAVDGASLAGRDAEAIHSLLGGSEGSRARLTVRGTNNRDRAIRVTRKDVAFPAVHAEALAGGVLLLRLSNFTEAAPGEMRAALRQHAPPLARNAGVILDLRGNTGGHLTGAYDLANLFVTEGFLFRGVASDGREAVRAQADRGTWDREPLVVLIDGLTMSAAEILAGALADADRALLVGDRTGGKGVAQREIDLPLGQALTVSILRIETASRRTLQGYGLWPHVEVAGETGDGAPGASVRQPYLWLDAVAAHPGPRLAISAAKVESDTGTGDAPLAVARAALAAWNRDRSLTLLQAARQAFPNAKAEEGGTPTAGR